MFLRGAGVALALPLLDAMAPVRAAGKADVPRRMVAIETNMGILPQYFFPEKPGAGYALSPYLERLGKFRTQFTVFSGVSHPEVTGAHAAEKCFLTGTPHPERGGFRNGVSLDQVAAEQIGNRTRYPSLVLGVGNEGQTLSFTRSGAPIPVERSPRKLFERLFVQGKAADVAARVAELRQGRSTLDFVGGQAKRLDRSLAPADRARLDQYYTSVRELEQRLAGSEAWEHKPKPKVAAAPPTDEKDGREFAKQTKLMFDVIRLALETDSSRLVSLFIDTTPIHNITHHGNRPEVLAELRAKEQGQFDVLAGFFQALTDAKEQGATLLDRTMVLYGTCMGSANSHSNSNLPVLLAGGGFKHGQHLAFDTTNNYPLTNLFVSMLQRLGIEAREFSTGKGTMRGLEPA
ncbi:hypothetical protein GobsT_13670 [Gemmata obscuriglobus]|uniref:DUF1552 domain-containing protein n=1 Tax=Gemmata obscuriglobus TaxID=114 RepID=A0A2Z3H5N0_9BACT|nr:DUF1552 domain-containing protein [Gemmata obscuriglobus]AWM40191.1 DUF1552 domain-containing protein [Gemmata obscuriglobus]QEG26624.1 hypothetical protein GobsT_13670 [Gemmata obscuriglobus]VTS02161.1 Secreted protein containing DUF1552 OS=Rhodopirellula europaea SH398 GN=RESH_04023 PE=4 SV=1: HXXSHH [Gemmata obscuriglobus UQM 2246]